MRYIALAVCCLGLAGCAGDSSRSACEVFTPPPAADPSAQEEQRIETQSTGDPTATASMPDERDCR